ncbi:MAG: SpoIID/LytB domain-containing protein [Phycisphaerales bacterium]|nr:SpoIID/LytB domain-containing protein [Phycisphaerales bacterium]
MKEMVISPPDGRGEPGHNRTDMEVEDVDSMMPKRRRADAPARAGLVTCLLAALATLGPAGCSTFDSPAGGGTGIITGPPLFRTEPDIRVRVKSGVQTAAVAGPGQFIIRPIGASARPDIMDGPLTVTSSAGLLRITGPAANREFPPGMDVEILPRAGASLPPSISAAGESRPAAGSGSASTAKTPAKDAAPSAIRLDGASYPGALVLRADSGPGTFDAVATMSIEEYLPGVLVKELWANFPKASFEAQAVASRSYALHERERARREGRRFDVESSTADQVFGGATSNAVANRAVVDTRGIVLVDRGQLLRAYFSSTCGGRPASAADTWPSSGANAFNLAAPLRAQRRDYACNGSKWYRWTTVRSDDDVSQRIRAWGRANGSPVGGIGRLRAVKVTDRNEADRPSRYLLTDDRGREFKLAAEDLRRACNQEVPELPALTQEQIVRSGDLEADFWADKVNIRGRGWGHGVGLCQWCAKGFADRKLHYQEILARFYPGAQLRRAF